MKRYGIPTAEYAVFSDPAEALQYIRGQGHYPTVIKADGLALGKGVLICADEAEATAALHSIMEDRVLGTPAAALSLRNFNRSGGFRPGLYRWQSHEADGRLKGPQACLGQRPRAKHRWDGHNQPKSLLYGGTRGDLHGNHLFAYHARDECGGTYVQGLPLFRPNVDAERP